jgi:hypothetical protein
LYYFHVISILVNPENAGQLKTCLFSMTNSFFFKSAFLFLALRGSTAISLALGCRLEE